MIESGETQVPDPMGILPWTFQPGLWPVPERADRDDTDGQPLAELSITPSQQVDAVRHSPRGEREARAHRSLLKPPTSAAPWARCWPAPPMRSPTRSRADRSSM